MSKGKQKRATGKKACEQAHFATLNVCGGGLESIEGAMEEIWELREGGAAPIRNTGREATKKLVENHARRASSVRRDLTVWGEIRRDGARYREVQRALAWMESG